MNWDWIKSLNIAVYRSVWVTWLCVAAVAVILVIAVLSTLFGFDPPTELIVTLLGFLAALAGVGAFQYGKMRDTDYEALRIKATAASPTNVTTVERGAVVQQAQVPPQETP